MTNNMNDNELNQVTGGTANYPGHANGNFAIYGNYIVYTVAPGDFLVSIAERFGVSYWQIAQWNNIKNPDKIEVGQALTIYPTIIR